MKLAVMPMANLPLSSLCLKPDNLGEEEEEEETELSHEGGPHLRGRLCCDVQSAQPPLRFLRPSFAREAPTEDYRICLTIRDKPASSSRDEDVKLEGCSRMSLRLELGHPACQTRTNASLQLTPS